MFWTVIPLLELLLKLSPDNTEVSAAIACLKREEAAIEAAFCD